MNDLGAADLGKRLRLARERAGVTQAQAADPDRAAQCSSLPAKYRDGRWRL